MNRKLLYLVGVMVLVMSIILSACATPSAPTTEPTAAVEEPAEEPPNHQQKNLKLKSRQRPRKSLAPEDSNRCLSALTATRKIIPACSRRLKQSMN